MKTRVPTFVVSILDLLKQAPVCKKSSCLLALTGVLAGTAHAQLLHRYDFSSGANDSVGTADGTLVGGTISGGELTTAGGAGGWSGSAPTTGVMLPSTAVAGLTGAFTIESWFVANYNGGYCTAFSFSDGTRNNYLLATPARGNAPYASSISVIGGGGAWTGPGDLQASEQYQDNGMLHQMVATYDGNTLSYYIDGALGSFNSLPASVVDPGLNLSTLTDIGINAGSPWPDNSIKGSTLDFRIYGQSLSAGQISGLYGLGSDATTASIETVIPEPSTLPMVAIGLLTVVAGRLKKSGCC